MPDYFTLAELRALPQVSDTLKYPDARCEAVADHMAAILEREVGTSFVGRVKSATLDGDGSTRVVMPSAHVLEVLSVTVGGVTVTGETYTARDGVLRRYPAGSTSPSAWPAGVENIAVEWLDGYTAVPPADVREAMLRGTRAYLVSTSSSSVMDDRRTSMSTEQGTVQFVVPGNRNPTGYPEVDAVIQAWAERLNIGFA